MGCTHSIPKAPPVEYIPTSSDLAKNCFDLQEEGLPEYSIKNHIAQSTITKSSSTKNNKLVELTIKKTKQMCVSEESDFPIGSLDQQCDTYRVDVEKDRGTFKVACVPRIGLAPQNEASLTWMYQTKNSQQHVPFGYWICDSWNGNNKFRIMTDTPNYPHQKYKTYHGKYPSNESTPFNNHRSSIDLYTYAYVEFEYKTSLIHIRVMGGRKCHGPNGNETHFRMRRANETCWILYIYHHNQYKECAMFIQTANIAKYTSEALSEYQVLICSGIDIHFVILLVTLADHFWTYRLRPCGIKMY